MSSKKYTNSSKTSNDSTQKGPSIKMSNGFEIPQIKYGMTYGSCPDGFYTRTEMTRLIAENAEMKAVMFHLTGKRWGIDLDPGKDGKILPTDSNLENLKNNEKIAQLQLCMNVMANVIAEYLTHLKKCAMPYMEAYYRNDTEEIKKHHQAFIPNHIKSIITFQRYVQSVMKDAERDHTEFKTMLFEHSQEEEIHHELENSYNLHYNIIPELQKKQGMTDNETAAYAIAEVAKRNDYETKIGNVKIDVSKIKMTTEDLKMKILDGYESTNISQQTEESKISYYDQLD
jgi:hypothetical protein